MPEAAYALKGRLSGASHAHLMSSEASEDFGCQNTKELQYCSRKHQYNFVSAVLLQQVVCFLFSPRRWHKSTFCQTNQGWLFCTSMQAVPHRLCQVQHLKVVSCMKCQSPMSRCLLFVSIVSSTTVLWVQMVEPFIEVVRFKQIAVLTEGEAFYCKHISSTVNQDNWGNV